MSRAKLEAARELIVEKKCAEARAILLSVSEEPYKAKAGEWLTKLGAMQPTKPKRKGLPAWTLLIAVVVLLVAALAANAYLTASIAPASNVLKSAVDDLDYNTTYCTSYCQFSNDTTCALTCRQTPAAVHRLK